MHAIIKKAMTAVALALGLAMAIPSSSHADGIYKIGTDGGGAPWTFFKSGKLVGFDVDVGNEVCARMKAKCQWVIQDWDGIFPALELGKFDMIFAGVTATDERRKSMDFSRTYCLSLVRFAAKRGSKFTDYKSSVDVINLDSLSGDAQAELNRLKAALGSASVGIQTASNEIPFIKQYFPDLKLREYEKQETRDLDMQAERIDLGMSGSVYWEKVQKMNEVDIVPFGPKFDGGVLGGGVAAAIKKGNTELKAKVDKALTSMIADGTMSKLSIKWFGSDAAPKN